MTKKDFKALVRDHLTPVEAVLYLDSTIEEALTNLRKKPIKDSIIYFYVVDKEFKLRGVVSTRRLLLSSLTATVSDIVEHSVVSLSGSQTLQEALEFLESHHLLALPVVDDQKRLLGKIDIETFLDESIDMAQARRRYDIFQLIGIQVDGKKKGSSWNNYSSRMPWIICNMFGGLMCAVISRIYSIVLAQFLVLAMFIPLILSLSESISMQSVTQGMQLIPKTPYRWKTLLQGLFHEWKAIVMLALTCGLTIGPISFLWGDGLYASLVIGLSMICSIILSASIGALLPVFLHKRKWDPKVAAGPVALMFADILTTALYLSLATYSLTQK